MQALPIVKKIIALAQQGISTPAFHTLFRLCRAADWRASGAIAVRYKIISITMMALVFGLSIVMALSPIILIVQAVCMGGAAVFILTRPSAAV